MAIIVADVANMNMALKLAILSSGQSQFDIAKAAGLHYSLLSMIVRGHREPTQEQAKAIAKVLRTKADQLFAEVA